VPNPADIPAIEERLSKLSAGDRLRWAAETFGARAGIGTSFQPAGIVILHLAKTQGLNLPAFTLNTGLLFPETLALKAQLEQHLGISIEDLVPEQTVEQQAQTHGAELWKRNPEKCCELRKVAVLGKKLFELDLWITGVRRDQSKERSVTPLLSLAARPDNSDVWKLNPLVDWSREQVWDYIKQHQIPYNVLHDRGYRSIGCAPCTAVTTSDDERSGRWVGFNKTECGLHNRPRPTL
jgi:phosphoadenosine phosphosulfate reductase